MKNEWMKKGDRNVILIDWMWGNIFDLKVSKANIQIVADQVAITVKYMKVRSYMFFILIFYTLFSTTV